MLSLCLQKARKLVGLLNPPKLLALVVTFLVMKKASEISCLSNLFRDPKSSTASSYEFFLEDNIIKKN